MTYTMAIIKQPDNTLFETLYRHFRKSIAINNPEARVRFSSLEKESFDKDYATTHAIELNVENALKANDITIISDVDMLQTAPIFDTELSGPWDIAITVRKTRYPINSGIVIAKPTQRAYDFLTRWAEVSLSLPKKPELYKVYASRYLYGDQAALGWMTENEPALAELAFFPCSTWNLTQTDWELFEPGKTKFCHIKSGIRKVIEGSYKRSMLSEKENEILTLWESYA